MRLPMGFMGTILIFWGWESHLLWMAVPLSLVLEGGRFLTVKWDLQVKDFNRFVDASTIFLATGFVIALATVPERALVLVVKWLPVIFFPIIGAQVYSTGGKIPVRSFFLAARKRMNIPVYGAGTVDIASVYGVVCLCAAGVGNPSDPLFYPACLLFSAWALWPVRPRRYLALVWMMLILAVGIVGYAGNKGYYSVRMQFFRFMVDFYGDLMNPDPFKTSTAIGDIGELKLSGNILLRVSFEPDLRGKTVYLHGATYDRFSYNTWFSSYPFESVPGNSSTATWQVSTGVLPGNTMTFYVRPKAKDLLFLPAGTFQLRDMMAGSVEKNGVASIRVSDCPALLKGTALFDVSPGYDAAPGPRDLLISKKEEEVIREIGLSLGLGSLAGRAAVRALEDYFSGHFSYSLDLAGRGRAKTPLANFLTQTKKGHCELFATATVLLLRSAGIPARYATGFLAHEYSPVSRMTLVRQMDAHAWVKAWIDGEWIRVDTTPPGFIRADREAAGNTLLRDFFSFLGFNLSRLRHETGPYLLDRFGLWLILPLVLILVYRLRFKKKVRQMKVARQAGKARLSAGSTQGLEKVAECLGKLGFDRFAHETWRGWFFRIQKGIKPLDIKLPLQEVIELENRRLFSRNGLTEKEKLAYETRVGGILETLSSASNR